MRDDIDGPVLMLFPFQLPGHCVYVIKEFDSAVSVQEIFPEDVMFLCFQINYNKGLVF